LFFHRTDKQGSVCHLEGKALVPPDGRLARDIQTNPPTLGFYIDKATAPMQNRGAGPATEQQGVASFNFPLFQYR
jgi:hypothetical protein